MTVWFTADEHFFHTNIARYENRPQWWMELIVDRHNEAVSAQDLVYHLGDFCFGSSDKAKEALQQMNGTHILIMGNHDRSDSWALRAGFNATFGTRKRSMYVDNQFSMACEEDPRIVMSHAPLAKLPSSRGKRVNVHGHIHSNGYPQEMGGQKPWHRNVCVDVTDFRPVSLEELLTPA